MCIFSCILYGKLIFRTTRRMFCLEQTHSLSLSLSLPHIIHLHIIANTMLKLIITTTVHNITLTPHTLLQTTSAALGFSARKPSQPNPTQHVQYRSFTEHFIRLSTPPFLAIIILQITKISFKHSRRILLRPPCTREALYSP